MLRDQTTLRGVGTSPMVIGGVTTEAARPANVLRKIEEPCSSGIFYDFLSELRWSARPGQSSHLESLPDLVNGRIDEQLEQERGKNPADHRCRDAAHDVHARPRRPHDGEQ